MGVNGTPFREYSEFDALLGESRENAEDCCFD